MVLYDGTGAVGRNRGESATSQLSDLGDEQRERGGSTLSVDSTLAADDVMLTLCLLLHGWLTASTRARAVLG